VRPRMPSVPKYCRVMLMPRLAHFRVLGPYALRVRPVRFAMSPGKANVTTAHAKRQKDV
jgi:hypothetical protein